MLIGMAWAFPGVIVLRFRDSNGFHSANMMHLPEKQGQAVWQTNTQVDQTDQTIHQLIWERN